MFAYFVTNCPELLCADFQEYYCIENIIRKCENGFSLKYAADLAAALPQNARTYVKITPDLAWSRQDQLLAHNAYLMECVLYVLAGGKGNKPKPIFKPPKQSQQAPNQAYMERFEELVRLGFAGGLEEVASIDEIEKKE